MAEGGAATGGVATRFGIPFDIWVSELELSGILLMDIAGLVKGPSGLADTSTLYTEPVVKPAAAPPSTSVVLANGD